MGSSLCENDNFRFLCENEGISFSHTTASNRRRHNGRGNAATCFSSKTSGIIGGERTRVALWSGIQPLFSSPGGRNLAPGQQTFCKSIFRSTSRFSIYTPLFNRLFHRRERKRKGPERTFNEFLQDEIQLWARYEKTKQIVTLRRQARRVRNRTTQTQNK